MNETRDGSHRASNTPSPPPIPPGQPAQAVPSAHLESTSPAPPVAPVSPTGLLIIDKQPGFTSMDVCAIIRARLRRAGAPKGVKVGHGGTLDPLATGVLVVLIGKATRLCDQVMATRKTYVTTIDLSRLSTTDDEAGECTPIDPALRATREDIERILPRFIGTIDQRPPAYSAINVGGRRSYELAREGTPIKLASRKVDIHGIRVEAFDWPKLSIVVECGKGVYIRSLARDVGAALGVGGMLSSLRRTESGQFSIEQAARLDQLPDKLTQADLLPLPSSP
ncbi:MAG: tRNA pseudouridine(55) synthase TruB [Phycisphaerales bacterium]|nr:tRNA pseudouridine(55) synthase TruB [Phycisphaerales bacterium]